jgi:hypothetical protein
VVGRSGGGYLLSAERLSPAVTEILMSVRSSTEQRMLTAAEFEVVKQTHYLVIAELSESEFVDAARRLRDYRKKARDLPRQQRREMRGKGERAVPGRSWTTPAPP